MHPSLEEPVPFDKSRLYKQTRSFKGCSIPQKEYSFSIGSIPLQKATSLENISLHFDQVVFYQHVNMHSFVHRPISEHTRYNTSGRKKQVAQKATAT